ncbi:Zinc finger C3H1 domain-containing protein [Polyrhizophydium stewartii]|uniref:Zinc finger C3H1 domain-containing protein n=1 Tax=Polyrhizophydium stewartii TaxID=2732419 RepID=A0ABR4NFF5_9FUNG
MPLMGSLPPIDFPSVFLPSAAAPLVRDHEPMDRAKVVEELRSRQEFHLLAHFLALPDDVQVRALLASENSAEKKWPALCEQIERLPSLGVPPSRWQELGINHVIVRVCSEDVGQVPDGQARSINRLCAVYRRSLNNALKQQRQRHRKLGILLAEQSRSRSGQSSKQMDRPTGSKRGVVSRPQSPVSAASTASGTPPALLRERTISGMAAAQARIAFLEEQLADLQSVDLPPSFSKRQKVVNKLAGLTNTFESAAPDLESRAPSPPTRSASRSAASTPATASPVLATLSIRPAAAAPAAPVIPALLATLTDLPASTASPAVLAPSAPEASATEAPTPASDQPPSMSTSNASRSGVKRPAESLDEAGVSSQQSQLLAPSRPIPSRIRDKLLMQQLSRRKFVRERPKNFVFLLSDHSDSDVGLDSDTETSDKHISIPTQPAAPPPPKSSKQAPTPPAADALFSKKYRGIYAAITSAATAARDNATPPVGLAAIDVNSIQDQSWCSDRAIARAYMCIEMRMQVKRKRAAALAAAAPSPSTAAQVVPAVSLTPSRSAAAASATPTRDAQSLAAKPADSTSKPVQSSNAASFELVVAVQSSSSVPSVADTEPCNPSAAPSTIDDAPMDISTPPHKDDAASGSAATSADPSPKPPLVSGEAVQDEKRLNIALESTRKAHKMLQAYIEQSSSVSKSIAMNERKEAEARETLARLRNELTSIDDQIAALQKRKAAIASQAADCETELAKVAAIVSARQTSLQRLKTQEAATIQDMIGTTKRIDELSARLHRPVPADIAAAAQLAQPLAKIPIKSPLRPARGAAAIKPAHLPISSQRPGAEQGSTSQPTSTASAKPAEAAATLESAAAMSLSKPSGSSSSNSDFIALEADSDDDNVDNAAKSREQDMRQHAPPVVSQPSVPDQAHMAAVGARPLPIGTIRPLVSLDNACPRELTDLALVSLLRGLDRSFTLDLDGDPLATRRTLSTNDPMHLDNEQGAVAVPAFKPYESALGHFRTFHLVDREANFSQFTSLTWSAKLNPAAVMCPFETSGGKCADSTCKNQHFRDLSMTDGELFEDLMETSARLLSTADVHALRDELHAKKRSGASLSELNQAVLAAIRRPDAAAIDKNLFLSTRIDGSRAAPAGEADARNKPAVRKGIARAVLDASAAIAPALPVMCRGLAALVSSESAGESRYYQISIAAADFEKLLAKDPHDVGSWISYAASQIKAPVSVDSLEKHSPNFNQALEILSRALVSNRSSEHVWLMYLELYQRRGKASDVRELFEQAIGFLPDCPVLWWMWASFERAEPAGSVCRVLCKMLVHFSNPALCIGDPRRRSLSLLSCVVQLAKQHVDALEPHKAAATLSRFLARDAEQLAEWAREVGVDAPPEHPLGLLNPVQRAVMLLLAVHVHAFGFLPENGFCEYPNHQLVKQQLFTVNWLHPLCAPSDEAIADIDALFAMWHASLCELRGDAMVIDTASGTFEDQKQAASWASSAVLRNQIAFERHIRGLDSDSIASLLQSLGPSGILSISDRLALGLVSQIDDAIADLDGKLDGTAAAFALANQACRTAFKDSQPDRIVQILSNCVRACFNGLPPLSAVDAWRHTQATLSLYRHALDLDITTLPDGRLLELRPHVSRAALHSSVFLWLNYMLLVAACSAGQTPVSSTMFDKALERIKGHEGRAVLWLEHLKFCLPDRALDEMTPPAPDARASRDDAKRALTVLSAALADLNVSAPHPLSLRPAGDSDFMRLVPLRDRSWTAMLADHCLLNLSMQEAQDLVALVFAEQIDVFPSASAMQLESPPKTDSDHQRAEWIASQAAQHAPSSSALVKYVAG